MKKIFTILCAVIFVFAAMVFSASLIGRSLADAALGELFNEQEEMKERISSALSEQLPQSGMLGEQVGTVVETVLESEAFSQQMETYFDIFLDDIVEGNNSANVLEETLRTAIEEQIDQLTLPAQSFVNKKQLTEALDAALDQVNFSQVYEQALDQLRNEMDPVSLSALHLLQWLRSDVLHYGALTAMAVTSVFFFMRGVKKGLQFLAVSALISGLLSGGIWLALRLFAMLTDSSWLSAMMIATTNALPYLSLILLLIAIAALLISIPLRRQP